MFTGPDFVARPNVRKNASALAWVMALAFVGVTGTLRAQGSATPRQPSDSVYQARMNAGYAASRIGNQLAAAAAFDSAATVAPTAAEPRNAAGYALLAAGKKLDAMVRFEASLAIDGERDVIRRQLGYLYADARRNADALTQFKAIRARGRATPQDLLAVGNLNALTGRSTEAIVAFRAALQMAEGTGDGAVATSARQAVANLSSVTTAQGSVAWFEYYLAPFYQNRFDNFLSFGFVRAGLTAKGWLHPSIYGSLRATRDSKSVGGIQPVLYADNTVLPALGVRVQPGGKWLVAYAEAGAAYPLVNVSPRDWHRDLRAGLIGTYGNQTALTGNPNGVVLVTELYGDGSWYDRFGRDLITYGQLRESIRLLQGSAGAVDIFGRAWTVVDSRNTYSNRVAEGGGGIALHFGASRRLTLYGDAVRGHYLASPPAGVVTRNYNDFRITLVTGMYHAFPLSRP